MNERNEETLEEQNRQRKIIETYDGDPEDLVFFQTTQDLETRTKQKQAERIWETLQQEPKEPVITESAEEIQESESAQQILETQPEESPVAGKIPENRGIDPQDPHYIDYVPDPYYEYGYGEEPEPVGKADGKKGDGTGLGVASMVTGICSIVFGCCGFQYVFSLAAIILGICCLTRKYKSGTAKVFAIVGIVLGSLILAMSILGMIFSFGYPIFSSYF